MQILWDYFLISLFISFLILYFIYPKPKVMIKIPSLDKPISDIYIDDNNVCYRYHRQEIDCPKKQ